MRRRLTPIAVYSNIFLVMLGLGVIGPNLTDIRASFGVSYGAIAWGVTAFAFARLLTNLPAGMAAARLPRLPLLLAGTVCVVVGSIAAGFSQNLEMFLIARGASGVGSAICSTVGLTLILDTADPAHRGKASGTFHSAIGGGAFFGPGFGGLLASFWGWRAALFGAGAAAAVSVILLALVISEGRKATPKHPKTELPELGSRQLPVLALLGGAATAYLAAFAIFFVRGSTQQTIIPLMGRDEIGLSSAALSIILMASAAVSSLVGPFAGSLSDRRGRRAVLLPGLALLALGTGLIASASSVPIFIAGIAVMSVAGTVSSIPSSMIVDSVSSAQRGFAIGIYRVVGDLALTAAPITAGFMVDSHGFRVAGLAATLVVALALVAEQWRAIRARRKPVYSVEEVIVAR